MLRGGYGIYWAPFNYPAPSTSTSNYGQVGFTQNTVLSQTTGTPTVALDNPFPTGVRAAVRQQPGLLSASAATSASSTRTARRRACSSGRSTCSASCGNGMALTVSYIGAQGRSSRRSAARTTSPSTSTSSIRSTWRSDAALNAALPNPFFGNPNVPASLVDAGDAAARAAAAAVPAVRQRQRAPGAPKARTATTRRSSSGRKRLTHGWGGRVSYTYSVLKDNQIGETNFYSSVGAACR